MSYQGKFVFAQLCSLLPKIKFYYEEKGEYYGQNVLGRLLMELREKGHLDYKLPDDALKFTELLRRVL